MQFIDELCNMRFMPQMYLVYVRKQMNLIFSKKFHILRYWNIWNVNVDLLYDAYIGFFLNFQLKLLWYG